MRMESPELVSRFLILCVPRRQVVRSKNKRSMSQRQHTAVHVPLQIVKLQIVNGYVDISAFFSTAPFLPANSPSSFPSSLFIFFSISLYVRIKVSICVTPRTVHLAFLRYSTRRWICQSLWYKTMRYHAIPDLRIPSRSKSIITGTYFFMLR